MLVHHGKVTAAWLQAWGTSLRVKASRLSDSEADCLIRLLGSIRADRARVCLDSRQGRRFFYCSWVLFVFPHVPLPCRHRPMSATGVVGHGLTSFSEKRLFCHSGRFGSSVRIVASQPCVPTDFKTVGFLFKCSLQLSGLRGKTILSYIQKQGQKCVPLLL